MNTSIKESYLNIVARSYLLSHAIQQFCQAQKEMLIEKINNLFKEAKIGGWTNQSTTSNPIP